MQAKRSVRGIAMSATVARHKTIPYQIIRSSRRTLCVEVRSSAVVVRSPYMLPKSIIEKFLAEKDDWIRSKLHSISKAKKQRLQGEIIYLGVKRKTVFSDSDFISGSEIGIKVSGKSGLEKQKRLEDFLKSQTQIFVGKYLKKHNFVKFRSLKYKLYKSKWGSCSRRNDLAFNVKLAMCSEQVIEYIVVHELCHILHKNHSKSFWQRVGTHFPEYRKTRKFLNKNKWVI